MKKYKKLIKGICKKCDIKHYNVNLINGKYYMLFDILEGNYKPYIKEYHITQAEFKNRICLDELI